VARSKSKTGSRSSKKAKAKASSKAKSAAKAKPVPKVKPKTTTRSATVTHADAVMATATAFQPIEDRVLIAVEEASETTAGGIIIPGNVESRPHRGTVLAKGPGRRGKKSQIRPLDVNVGDHVLFPEHAGSKIQIAGDDFLILREEELLGIVTV
jgi:chaperonin GroES